MYAHSLATDWLRLATPAFIIEFLFVSPLSEHGISGFDSELKIPKSC